MGLLIKIFVPKDIELCILIIIEFKYISTCFVCSFDSIRKSTYLVWTLLQCWCLPKWSSNSIGKKFFVKDISIGSEPGWDTKKVASFEPWWVCFYRSESLSVFSIIRERQPYVCFILTIGEKIFSAMWLVVPFSQSDFSKNFSSYS
jgi:hypothetical protein